jgi:hypothetical protein
MRRSMSGNEVDVIGCFARSQLSPEEIAKHPDGGAALHGKFANAWPHSHTERGAKPRGRARKARTGTSQARRYNPRRPLVSSSGASPFDFKRRL